MNLMSQKEKLLCDERLRVQFITHSTERYSYTDSARLALEGGCRWIQLRMKDATPDEILRAAAPVGELCRQYDAVFLLDDHVELVEAAGAHGVHLGKNDMPIGEARRLLGNDAIIGGTANTLEDVVRLHQAGADYIGCGPFRYTTTKKNLSPILGEAGYRQIMDEMKRLHINIPLVAIGGITNADIPLLLNAGVNGIALSGSILRADNPVEEMRQIRLRI